MAGYDDNDASQTTMGPGMMQPPASKATPTGPEMGAALGSLDALETTPLDDETYIAFPHDDFPKLSSEQKGARVLVVMAGEVLEPDEDGNTVVCMKEASVLHGNKSALGSGDRFKTLEHQLERRGAHDPAALAAYIGRRKYGAKRFNQLSARARRNG